MNRRMSNGALPKFKYIDHTEDQDEPEYGPATPVESISRLRASFQKSLTSGLSGPNGKSTQDSSVTSLPSRRSMKSMFQSKSLLQLALETERKEASTRLKMEAEMRKRANKMIFSLHGPLKRNGWKPSQHIKHSVFMLDSSGKLRYDMTGTSKSWTKLDLHLKSGDTSDLSRRGSLPSLLSDRQGIGFRTANHIKVAVACRPMNDREKSDGHFRSVRVDEKQEEIHVETEESDEVYQFDNVFPHDTKPQDIFNKTAKGIVNSVLLGYNGTILTYGQRGSGKTHMMNAMVPNCFDYMYRLIKQAGKKVSYSVRMSFLEICNNELSDLMRQESRLSWKRPRVVNSEQAGVHVRNVKFVPVRNRAEMDHAISVAVANRLAADTARAKEAKVEREGKQVTPKGTNKPPHFVINVLVKRIERHYNISREETRLSKFLLVDIGGGVSRERNLDPSLSALNNVIGTLAGQPFHTVEYEKSTLTHLLRESFGGNARTLMLATISPTSDNTQETLSTLQLTSQAQQIKNNAIINVDFKGDKMQQLLKKDGWVRCFPCCWSRGGQQISPNKQQHKKSLYEDAAPGSSTTNLHV